MTNDIFFMTFCFENLKIFKNKNGCFIHLMYYVIYFVMMNTIIV